MGVYLLVNFLLDKLKRIDIPTDKFLSCLKEKKYSLDGKEKFSLLRLEKVSAAWETEDKTMLKIKGKMIVKSKKFLEIDFSSFMPVSQFSWLEKYGIFLKEFNYRREFGFYWWKVLILIIVIMISIQIFNYVAFFLPDKLYRLGF